MSDQGESLFRSFQQVVAEAFSVQGEKHSPGKGLLLARGGGVGPCILPPIQSSQGAPQEGRTRRADRLQLGQRRVPPAWVNV